MQRKLSKLKEIEKIGYLTSRRGHCTNLKLNERRTVSQILLMRVKSTPESVFGDLIDADVNAAISLAKDRIEWKKNRPIELLLVPFRE